MDDRTLTMPDGRTVGYADFGGAGMAVIEAHGGPGSRFEARAMAEQPEAVGAGLRLIGIDRPGYGRSDPLPGRVIADWTADALAVADALGVERFAIIGVSTGASYSMAVASMAPERVVAAMAVCGITDMREPSVRDEVTADPDGPFAAIWRAPTRDAAIEVALRQWGEDGSRAGIDPDGAPAAPLAPADMAMFADPTWLTGMLADLQHSFAFGVQGYADDRIADGEGWHSFDVSRIRCPVVVLHGAADTIAPVSLARHTASIVPGAVLDVRPDLGHFSITPHAIPALLSVLDG